MDIAQADLQLKREPFARPFGFKGSAFHEKWCPVVRLVDDAGREAIGVGGLAVLWSDARVFAAHTETGGDALQLAALEEALRRVAGKAFPDPMALHDAIIDDVHEYACRITGLADLRRTFTLVPLSALDYAAWLLHARERGIGRFDDLIPDRFRPYLSDRQRSVALAPAVGYTLPTEELGALLDAGVHVLKIKIGQPGAEDEMLAKDIAWLDRTHALAGGIETDRTESGRVLYYLDANGRYGRKETMARLLDHCRDAGYLDRVILVEEPFARPDQLDVHGLPARFAGDESVESADDVRTRIEQGYGAIAIKTAGKTVSRSFRMIAAAREAGATCFVADNACVPMMVEWNKNVAARLPAFPGLPGQLLESNGPENYARWDDMLAEFPLADAAWLRPCRGAFELDEAYYRRSGGIFETPGAYAGLF
ncbi:MAG: L-alanine-DL-glutamate epimerase, partial [Planctomycetota bacterium]